ncbi:MAG: 23S rRNA (uracil(1939)-C(5))-methyltransferase RlmD [Ekhidna sp.]|uniref:23S rRNA (uracil(1939)-C(5))-methyltransferase RlmD n=1 Tax=Ekhidna sp. TaxID=2608089 RepID=UPI0032ED4DE7
MNSNFVRMKKGAIIEELEITGISSEGKGVGRVNGQVVFVKETVPGDVVQAKIIGKKKKFLEAYAEEILEKSGERIEPFCEHFGLCGGCKWQHMTYEAQLKYKQSHVEENLRKLSGLDLPEVMPIIGSGRTSFYRNKLEFTFSNFRWLTKEEIASGEDVVRTGLGFHIPKQFNKVIDIQKCHLQADPSNAIRLAVKAFADANDISFYDVKKQEGFLRNLVIRTATTGDLMVILQMYYRDQELIELMLNFLKKEFPQITSLMYVVNEKGNDSFSDLEVELFGGKDHIMEQMGDLKFKIGPKSFYQTNSEQAHELYKVAADFANLKIDELVYDLYTGTGTIANFVARSAKKVVGIEYVEEAIEDAKINSEINGIANTEFFAGDMKDLLANEFINQHGKPDVIITDPPRAGMHPRVTQLLADLRVDRIVYVSCNPATQARDLEVLGQSYDVVKIQPVDMFPQTQHVENVILLQLKD